MSVVKGEVEFIEEQGRAMVAEAVSVAITVPASVEAVFAVLAEPASHAAIDGTGWVCEPLDGERLTSSGQGFRITYDWSGATPEARTVLDFPPFGVEHLEDSLRHLAVLATAEDGRGAGRPSRRARRPASGASAAVVDPL